MQRCNGCPRAQEGVTCMTPSEMGYKRGAEFSVTLKDRETQEVTKLSGRLVADLNTTMPVAEVDGEESLIPVCYCGLKRSKEG